MSTETHTSGDRGQQEARAEWNDARERADRLVSIFRGKEAVLAKYAAEDAALRRVFRENENRADPFTPMFRTGPERDAAIRDILDRLDADDAAYRELRDRVGQLEWANPTSSDVQRLKQQLSALEEITTNVRAHRDLEQRVAALEADRPIATEAPVRLQEASGPGSVLGFTVKTDPNMPPYQVRFLQDGKTVGVLRDFGLPIETPDFATKLMDAAHCAPEPVAEEMGLIVGSPGYYRVRVRLGGQCLFTGDFYHMIDAEDACDAINAALRSPATEEAP